MTATPLDLSTHGRLNRMDMYNVIEDSKASIDLQVESVLYSMIYAAISFKMHYSMHAVSTILWDTNSADHIKKLKEKTT